MLMFQVNGELKSQIHWNTLNGPWRARNIKDMTTGKTTGNAYTLYVADNTLGLFKSDLSGFKWEQMSFPYSDILSIEANPNTAQQFYVAYKDGGEGHIQGTADGGATFQLKLNYPFLQPKHFGISKVEPKHVFLGSLYDNAHSTPVLWKNLNGISEPTFVADETFSNIHTNLLAIAWHTDNPDAVVVGGSAVDVADPLLPPPTEGTYYDEQLQQTTMFAKGIWISYDAGEHWDLIPGGNKNISALWFSGTQEFPKIFAGTTSSDTDPYSRLFEIVKDSAGDWHWLQKREYKLTNGPSTAITSFMLDGEERLYFSVSGLGIGIYNLQTGNVTSPSTTNRFFADWNILGFVDNPNPENDGEFYAFSPTSVYYSEYNGPGQGAEWVPMNKGFEIVNSSSIAAINNNILSGSKTWGGTNLLLPSNFGNWIHRLTGYDANGILLDDELKFGYTHFESEQMYYPSQVQEYGFAVGTVLLANQNYRSSVIIRKNAESNRWYEQFRSGSISVNENRLYGIIAEPNNNNNIYAYGKTTAGSDPTNELAYSNYFISTNMGYDWNTAGIIGGVSPIPIVYSMCIDYDETSSFPADTMYAGLKEKGVYRTTDGGSHWYQSLEQSNTIRAVVLNPRNSSTVYAGGDELNSSSCSM